MTLHSALNRSTQPEGYMGSSYHARCTARVCLSNGRNWHTACFDANYAWSCECEGCGYDDVGYVYIHMDNVFYLDADAPDYDDSEDEEDHNNDGPGVCSLCFHGTHHETFVNTEIAPLRRAS